MATSHLVTRSTRHRSTRHTPVSSHSQLVTSEHITKLSIVIFYLHAGQVTPRNSAQRGQLLDNMRKRQLADCQFADWTTLGLDISRTRQFTYWTSHRMDNSRMPPSTLRAYFSFFWWHLRDRELSNPQLVQSASWLVRELSSPQVDQSAGCAVCELAYPRVVQLPHRWRTYSKRAYNKTYAMPCSSVWLFGFNVCNIKITDDGKALECNKC